MRLGALGMREKGMGRGLAVSGIPADALSVGDWTLTPDDGQLIINITSQPDLNGGTLQALVLSIYDVTGSVLVDGEFIIPKAGSLVGQITLDMDTIFGAASNGNEFSIECVIRTNYGDSEPSDTKTGTPANPAIYSDDFSTDTSGDWTPQTDGIVTVEAGRLRVANGGSGYGRGYLEVTGLSIGVDYTFYYDNFNGTGAARLRLGTSAGDGSYLTDNTEGTGKSHTFTATATSLFITVYCQVATTTGVYSEADNFLLEAA